MLKKIIKNNKVLFTLALLIKDFFLKKKHTLTLQSKEQEYLKQLNDNGVAVIPNFFSPQECQILIEEFEKIDNKFIHKYCNDKRIYGIEKLSSKYKELFHDNEMFKRIGEAYIGDELILQTTMAANIKYDKNCETFGSGGSWHRDSFSRQFKAIVYLNDVTMKNGPFMYIKGSHTLTNIIKVIWKLKKTTPPSDFRYTEKEMNSIKKILKEDITYYCAKKGTLLLADIRGLHTGMPLKKDERYSIFNYYIAKSDHQLNNNIEKLANISLSLNLNGDITKDIKNS